MYQKDKPKNGLFLSNCLKFWVNYLCFKNIFLLCRAVVAQNVYKS